MSSVPNNPYRFDRSELVKTILEAVESRWRSHFSLANPTWNYVTPDLITAAAAVKATHAIRGLIDHPLTDIAKTFGGLFGERYAADHAVAEADQVWRTQVIPQAERQKCPPEQIIAPSADPVWIIRECVILPVWTEEFFKPLMPYAESLRAGFVAAMRASDDAMPLAGDLFNRLAAARISKDRELIDRTLSAAVQFLEQFVPTRRDSSQSHLEYAAGKVEPASQGKIGMGSGSPQLLTLREFTKVCGIPMGTLEKKTKSRAKPIIPRRGPRPAKFLYQDLCKWFLTEWPSQAPSLPESFEKAWTVIRAAAKEKESSRKHKADSSG